MIPPTMTPEGGRPSRRDGNDPPAADARQRLVVAATFLLVLLAGGLGGIAVDRWLLRPRDRLDSEVVLLQPRDATERELAQELRLTPAQREHLDSLLINAQARVRAVSREAGPRFRAILAETLTGLDAILTPEQRSRLRAIRRERRLVWQERIDALRRRGFEIPDGMDSTRRD